MANIVSFSNDGLIPMEAVVTMGISAKDGDNPIGYFGTGLKYAIASLLRTSQRITIWCGLDRYDFATEAGEVRGKEFQFIVMTGPGGSQRLGFTTHLGANWEVWQVFRELYSNCLDEGGSMSFSAVEPSEGRTVIQVTGAAFCIAAQNKREYFLTSEPLYSGLFVDVHPGPSSGIFYRGVRVASLAAPSIHTYNITTATELTEDRTLKGSPDWYVAYSLANCTKPGIISSAVTAGEFRYEGNLTYSDPNETFAETVLEICEMQGVGNVAQSAVRAAEVWAQREARVKPCHLSARETADIEAAKAFLARIGYPVTHPIVCTETLGANIAGMARDGKIFLSRIPLSRGGNYLISTILEEQLHLQHGFLDESRRFQDFLFDLLVKYAKDAEFARVAA